MSETTERDIDALRDNIEETRGRISGEIEAIGDRLTPEHAREVARGKMIDVKDRAVSRVKGTARSAYDKAAVQTERLPRVVRENPVPFGMLAVGTVGGAILAVSEIRKRRMREGTQLELELESTETTLYEEPVSTETVVGGETYSTKPSLRERARSRFGSVADTAKSRLGDGMSSVKGRVSSAKERAGHYATRGREGASHLADRSRGAYGNNPLMFGGACVLAGIGLGLLLPHTQREDRVLGGRRERVVTRAKHIASDAKDVAIDSAKEGFRTARETAKQEARERDLSIR